MPVYVICGNALGQAQVRQQFTLHSIDFQKTSHKIFKKIFPYKSNV
jgi:hypothetical protein